MEWMQFVDRYGLPLTAIVAISFFVGKALRWVGVQVLAPVVKRHLKFIDQIDDRLDNLAAAFGDSRKAELSRLDHIATKLEEITGTLDRQIRQVVVKAESVAIVPSASGPKT